MASTFKFHSKVNETVPWQAQYSFPSQATRVNKQTVKLPPKNGGTFAPGNIVRIEFPADNYFNALNSVLQFDLTWTGGTLPRFQRGGAQNVIKRLRVMYGSLVLEDIQEYKTIVRILTEAGVQNDYMSSIGTVLDGMYEPMEYVAQQASGGGAVGASLSNVTYSTTIATLAGQLSENLIPAQQVAIALSAAKRTYCLNLLSGILTSKKLIPLKWMAAQLSIELTLADVGDACIATAAPTSYVFDSCNYITEMLEFDSTYDTAFYSGLQNGGVPIKFSSWHFHSFSFTGATQIFQIHERSRSVKAAFAVVRSTVSTSVTSDSDTFFHAAGAIDGDNVTATGVYSAGTTGPIDTFQWRVGGRYYPAQPVRCSNGGAEALVELLKTVNALGDYTKASCINYLNWVSSTTTNPGSKFVMACEFENVDVMPDTIAGINAEEQSDIALIISLASGTPAAKKVDVFMHYDALLIVKDGNTVDLVM